VKTNILVFNFFVIFFFIHLHNNLIEVRLCLYMCAEQRDGRVMYSILLKGIQVKCIVQLAEKEIPNCMKNLHGGGGIQIVEHIY